MKGRILKDEDIFKQFSKGKICVFVKPTNDDRLEDIAKKLGIDYLTEAFSLQYYVAEFSDKKEAHKYLMSFRKKLRDDVYACLYVDGQFEDEHT